MHNEGLRNKRENRLQNIRYCRRLFKKAVEKIKFLNLPNRVIIRMHFNV